MKKSLACGLFSAIIAISAWGQSGSRSGTISPYSQYVLGTLADQSQVAGRGMAGTGLAMRSGTVVNTLNPASYSAVDSLTMLFDAGLSGQLVNFKEGSTSVNARSGGFDYAVGLFRMRRHLGVSFGLLPFSDVGYTYTASSYLNNTLGGITEVYSGSGGLHQAFVGMGWNPVAGLSVGVNAAYLWGTLDRSVVSTASQSTSTSTINSLSKRYSSSVNSYNLTFGMQWEQPLGRRDALTLGATLGLGHNLGAEAVCDIVNQNTATLVSDTAHFAVADALELPLSYGVGLAWNHRQRLTVAADYSSQRWGSLDYPDFDEQKAAYVMRSGLLSHRDRLSMGIDYVPNAASISHYLHRVHYRVGVAYTSPYYKVNGHDGPSQLNVSAGLGLPLQNRWGARSVLNVSAQWERTSATGLITDNTFRLSLGLTFNERWFAKWRID